MDGQPNRPTDGGFDKSLQLARLYVALDEIRAKIINEALTLGGHLGVDDPDLMCALEECEQKIEAHFEHFRLRADRLRRT